jgi:hypothetical protein
VWGHSLRSTFHRLHLLRLWTPMIVLGIITVLIFDLITVLIFDLITVLDFRDY